MSSGSISPRTVADVWKPYQPFISKNSNVWHHSSPVHGRALPRCSGRMGFLDHQKRRHRFTFRWVSPVWLTRWGRPGSRVLVDRLWPRGLAKGEAPFATWAKEVAPSSELRKWYGHVPERFQEFARRYRTELATSPGCDAIDALRQRARASDVVLLTATKDLKCSGAAVLQTILGGS